MRPDATLTDTAIQEVHLEIVITNARDQLPFRGDLDLVLRIEGHDLGNAVIGAASGQREGDWRAAGGGKRHVDSCGAAEAAVQTELVRFLATELHAGKDSVIYRTGLKVPVEVGLVEGVLTALRIVIGAD